MLSLIFYRAAVLGGAAFLACGAASAKDIVQTAADTGKFTSLLQAARAAGLEKTLASAGPFTVFAPTDAAFGALPAGTVDELLKTENKDKLAKLLTYHVVTGRFHTKDAEGSTAGIELKSLESQGLTVKASGGKFTVNDAAIVMADVEADNGVIQVVDKVLMPPMPVQPALKQEQK